MGFHILRWLLGIFVILFVFWFGMKVGELKGQIESGRGWSGMRHHSMMIEYGGYGMMSPGTVQSAPASK